MTKRFWQSQGSGKVFGMGIGRMSTVSLFGMGLLLLASPAFAHHPTGGEIPSTVFEGFWSGLAHPVIGLDHFAFIVAVGLLATIQRAWGWVLPVVFVAGTLGGTGLHLGRVDLPGLELVISLSVLTFGLILALGRGVSGITMVPWVRSLTITVLGAIAGLFHGYAYGEAVIGAEMTPILAYLAGFALVQLGIAIATLTLARRWCSAPEAAELPLRFAGFTLLGIGATFLSSAVLG